MPRLLVLRVLLCLVVTVSFGRTCWLMTEGPFLGTLPLQIVQHAREYRVAAREGMALPEGLAPGQVIALGRMSARDRATMTYAREIQAGTPLTLVVLQNGQPQPVPIATGSLLSTKLDALQYWVGLLAMCMLLPVSLLTLLRGRDGTAWGLGLFASGVLIYNGLLGGPFPPALTVWLQPLGRAVVILSLTCLYGMAECLAGEGLSRRWRLLFRAIVAFATAAYLFSVIGTDLLVVHAATVLPEWVGEVAGRLSVVQILVPVLALVLGYGRASPERRRRMRWVLGSTALLTVSFLLLALVPVSNQPLLYVLFNTVLPGIAMLGYLYAILRSRVVDVTFVVDRALLFSVITALLFGMFSLLEQGVHRLALGEQLGWMVQALGAAGVAALLSPLHRLLDRGLERVFFHRLRTMAGALRRLAMESSFFENEEALLSRAVRQLLVSCADVAIYERSGAVYQRRVAGGGAWPATLDADDPVFVALRAHHTALEVRGLESAVGADGLAFPMTVGQLLTGAVTCRLREGEQLDRDVRAAIADLALALGAALYLLRHREQSQLIAELAAGRLDQTAAQTRASALVGSP